MVALFNIAYTVRIVMILIVGAVFGLQDLGEVGIVQVELLLSVVTELVPVCFYLY